MSYFHSVSLHFFDSSVLSKLVSIEILSDSFSIMATHDFFLRYDFVWHG